MSPVNHITLILRKWRSQPGQIKNQRKKILGHELAGEIEALGRDVTMFRKGDAVFGTTGFRGGAHAEYICLPEDFI